MKRKIIVAILIALVLCCTIVLVLCKKNNGDDPPVGGVTNLTMEQAVERVQNMPKSTDGNTIENAIDEVFDVGVDLPEGTYSAQTYTVNGVSAYVVTVSGAGTNATDYYNSIKEKMLAEGYTTEGAEFAFYKVVGAVIYTVSVEDDEGVIYIATGVASPTSDSSDSTDPGNPTDPTNPTNPSNPSNPSNPVTLPEGNLNAFPVATINDMFAPLGVTIPDCTSGSSYSIDVQYNNTETGVMSITVTCYGMTADEREAYTQSLKDVGFQSQYHLVYEHSNRFYSDLVATTTFHDGNQTYSITFSATYEEPAYVLPENVKITYVEDSFYYYTAIKIGNDYYVKEEMSYDGLQMTLEEELYYKRTNSGWELWSDYGDGWEKSNYENTTEIEYVERTIFSFITEEADIDPDAVQGENTTLLGKTVEVWDYDAGYGATFKYYKDAESGIILKYESTMYGFVMVSTVTSIDTSVTSFEGIELPQ